jgi:hypothetical protein
MNKVIVFLLLSCTCLLMISCASLGTKTLYVNPVQLKINRIGFSRLNGKMIVDRIFPQTDSIFSATLTQTLGKYSITDVLKVDKEFPISTPNTSEIINICKTNNLDAFMISKLKFIHVTQSVAFIPISQNYDTEVEMKLYDNEGNLLINVTHNTLKGNSYMMPPPAERTIQDGIKGAIKRIAKEYGWVK